MLKGMILVIDYELKKCIYKYKRDYKTKKFTCRDQFMVMSYAQFTRSSSLRVVEATLTAFSSKLYHSRLKLMNKSILAEMNVNRNGLFIKILRRFSSNEQVICIRMIISELVSKKWCTPLIVVLLNFT